MYVCVKGDFEKFEAKNRKKKIYAAFRHAFVRVFRVKTEPLCLKGHRRCVVSDIAFAIQDGFSNHRRHRHGLRLTVRQGKFNAFAAALF